PLHTHRPPRHLHTFPTRRSSDLYQSDRIKLVIGATPDGAREDLPRTPDNAAIIGDPRNDEHMMIAGIHCAFILAHNNTVDLLKRSEEHTSELQSRENLVCRLLLE